MTSELDDARNPLSFLYNFRFPDGTERAFDLKLDRKTLNLILPQNRTYPEWAELDFFKCPICTLDHGRYRFCPVATNLQDVVSFFGGSISYQEVEVSIETDERKYVKQTALQNGLSSLIGLYMVTSGCPGMEKLKPMVRYHLPFATEEETKYRVLSMYLLAQFFLGKRGKRPDWSLQNLVAMYEDIRIINRSFYKRLANIKLEDASKNALIILDCFADSVTFSINKKLLDDIEVMFSAYF
ncbi:MAG: hypothetical protein HZA17_04540 [Nitrospirae bacterium]|nr:hypothetical protein [Nitrospirota bacterium]